MEPALNQDEQVVEQSIQTLLEGLPLPVQNFLKSDRKNQVVSTLSTKHGLHADQAGSFEKEFLLMLLGVHSPEQFVSELEKVGFGEEVVEGLIADLNQQVFTPLRAEVQKQAQEQPRPEANLSPMPAPQPEPQTSPTPSMRTMVSDIEHLKGKEDATLAPKAPEAAPQAPKPHTPPVPQPAPQAPVARVVPPVAPTPDVVLPKNPLPPQPRPQPRPQPPTPNQDALRDTLKKYGVDPYHEPIE